MTKNEAAADALKKAEAERQAKRRGAARLNKAMRKAEAEASQNMSRLTGGLNLGGLF